MTDTTTTIKTEGTSPHVPPRETEKDTESPSTTDQDTTLPMSTESSTTQVVIKPPQPPQQPPVNEYPYYGTTKPPRRRPERVSSETSEIIALIIGIIAGALIAVILIILLILKFKSRGEASYKVDDGKGYQQGPNAALLGSSTNGHSQTQYQLNGALRNGDKSQMQKSKKRDSKDIKEWYV